MSALVLTATTMHIINGAFHQTCSWRPYFEIFITTTIGFQNGLHLTRALLQKNVNKLDHFPSTTITGLLARMDAGSLAAVTGYAGELHAVMVYHCSVSV